MITTTDIILGLAFLAAGLLLPKVHMWPWRAVKWVGLAFWHVGSAAILFPGNLLLGGKAEEKPRSGYATRADDWKFLSDGSDFTVASGPPSPTITVGEVWEDRGTQFEVYELNNRHARCIINGAKDSFGWYIPYILRNWTKVREADGTEVKE